MKAKLFYILASLIWLIPVVFNPCFAADCTQEAKAELKKAADEDTKKAILNAVKAYEDFNKAAESYLNCETGVEFKKGASFEPSKEMDIKAKELGISAWSSDKYKNFSYDWGGMKAHDSKCASYLSMAKPLLDNFIKQYGVADKYVRAANAAQSDKDCGCDENGTQIAECTSASADGSEAANQDSECKPFTGYLQEMTDMCPLCAVFEVILNADAKISMIAWNGTAHPLINVVTIFFLVMVALEALKAVSAIAGTRISSFLKNLLTIGLKVSIAILLLSDVTYIYGLFISPVLSGGLDMGMAIVQSSGAAECAPQAPGSPIQSGALDSEILSNIYSTVRCFGNSAATMPALGRGLLCNALTGGIMSWDIGMWFSGLIMLIFGLMIWLAVSFYLIDCTVQLAFFTALVPLFIAFWPFKLTQSYTVKGVKLMMNTFFNFAMIGVILLIATHIVSFAVNGNGDFDLNAMIDAMNNNDAATLKENTQLDCLQILVLLVCCICALKLLAATNKLSDQFSKGAGTDIGTNIGGLAGSAVTNVGLAGGKLTAQGLGDATKAMYEGSLLKAHVDSSVDSARKAWAKGWQRAGRAVGLGQYQAQQQMTGSGKPDIGGGGSGGPSGSGGGDDINHMFPPETHDTGNAEMDTMLNQRDQKMKSGYDTGNAKADKKLNDEYREELENAETRGRALGMTGKEYREIEPIKMAFGETAEGEAAWAKYMEMSRKYNQKDENGLMIESPEAREAFKEYRQKEKEYVKNNFNDRTYQNYCKYEENEPDNPLNDTEENEFEDRTPSGEGGPNSQPETTHNNTGGKPNTGGPQPVQPQSSTTQPDTGRSQPTGNGGVNPVTAQDAEVQEVMPQPVEEEIVQEAHNAQGGSPEKPKTGKQSEDDETKASGKDSTEKEEQIERAEKEKKVKDGQIISEDIKKK